MLYYFYCFRKEICLFQHCNGSSSYLFVNGVKIYKFKAKESEITGYTLCLANISKDFSVNNMKETGLNANVYDFQLIILELMMVLFRIFINI